MVPEFQITVIHKIKPEMFKNFGIIGKPFTVHMKRFMKNHKMHEINVDAFCTSTLYVHN